jgi:hypothetical protein
MITNQTTGEPVADATVTLSRFASQAPESVDVTTTTDADGRYRFDNVETGDGFVHAVSLNYRGVLYSSGMIRMNETPNATADVAVFETTTSQAALSISTRGLILTGANPQTGMVSITDVLTFENSGDQTIVEDDDGRTLRISVPESSSQVSLRPGFNFGTASVEGATVFATTPIPPGDTNPSLDYTIPYSDTNLSFELTSDYPTEALRILVPVSDDFSDITVRSGGGLLLDGGIVQIGDGDFHVWTGGNIPSDDTLELVFEGLPEPIAERDELRTIEPAAIAFIALLAASGVTAWLVSQRGLMRPRPVAVAPAAAATLQARRDELADELRFIEGQHAEQRIDEAAYQTERRAILEELRSISRQMRGIGDDE